MPSGPAGLACVCRLHICLPDNSMWYCLRNPLSPLHVRPAPIISFVLPLHVPHARMSLTHACSGSLCSWYSASPHLPVPRSTTGPTATWCWSSTAAWPTTRPWTHDGHVAAALVQRGEGRARVGRHGHVLGALWGWPCGHATCRRLQVWSTGDRGVTIAIMAVCSAMATDHCGSGRHRCADCCGVHGRLEYVVVPDVGQC